MKKLVLFSFLFSLNANASSELSLFDCKTLSAIGGTYKIKNQNAQVIIEDVSAEYCVEPSLTVVENLREPKEYFTCLSQNSAQKDVKLEILGNKLVLTCLFSDSQKTVTKFSLDALGHLKKINLLKSFGDKQVEVLDIILE